MKTSLKGLHAPVLAAAVREKTAATAIAQIQNCVYDGAKMIDLHMSALENSDEATLKRIVDGSRLPILALNYNNLYDWSSAGIPEDERIESFRRAARAGVAGIDMQGYTFHRPSQCEFCGENKYSFTKDSPKEVVTDKEIIKKQCDLIEEMHSLDVEVLLSCHPGVPMNCEQVLDLVRFYEERNPDIIKLVTIANTEDEMLESFRTMSVVRREIKTPVTLLAGGKFGALTRIINPVLGSHMIFCVDRYSESSTLGQIDLKTADSILRQIDRIG